MPGLAAGLTLRPTSFLVQSLVFVANMQRIGQRVTRRLKKCIENLKMKYPVFILRDQWDFRPLIPATVTCGVCCGALQSIVALLLLNHEILNYRTHGISLIITGYYVCYWRVVVFFVWSCVCEKESIWLRDYRALTLVCLFACAHWANCNTMVSQHSRLSSLAASNMLPHINWDWAYSVSQWDFRVGQPLSLFFLSSYWWSTKIPLCDTLCSPVRLTSENKCLILNLALSYWGSPTKIKREFPADWKYTYRLRMHNNKWWCRLHINECLPLIGYL